MFVVTENNYTIHVSEDYVLSTGETFSYRTEKDGVINILFSYCSSDRPSITV